MRTRLVLCVLTMGCAMAQPTPSRIVHRFGAAGFDQGRGVATDLTGNIYVASAFTGTVNFAPSGTRELTSLGGTDIALARYSGETGALDWVIRIGGTGAETVTSLITDLAGNIYIAGSFSGTVNFNPNGTLIRTSVGQRDMFIARFNPDGRLVWAIAYGSTRDDEVTDLAVDPEGTIAYGGVTRGSTIDINPTGGDSFTPSGPMGVFAAKLDSEGRYLWGRGFASAFDEPGTKVTVLLDPRGRLTVAGSFRGIADLGSDFRVENQEPVNQVFLAYYIAENVFQWGGSVAAAQAINPVSMTQDGQGNFYLTGTYVGGANLDRKREARPLPALGGTDIFVAKYNRFGDHQFSLGMGGPQDDAPTKIISDGNSLFFLAGLFRGEAVLAPLPSTRLSTALGTGGASDAFVGAFGTTDGSLNWLNTLGAPVSGPAQTTQVRGIALDQQGNVAVAGGFFGAPVVEPDGANTRLSSAGDSDIFVIRYLGNGRIVERVPPPPPRPAINAVTSAAAAVQGPLAPGGIHTIFGDNLAAPPAVASQAFPLPTQSCGITVRITDSAGASVNAPLYYCSANQINFVAPSNLAAGAARVETGGASATVTVGPLNPAIFTGAVIFATGPKAGQVVTVSNPARPGDVLTVFLTGMGAVTPPVPSDAAAVAALHTTVVTPTMTVGTQAAEVLFSGLTPGFAGLYQVNFIAPAGLAAGNQPLVIRAGTRESNTLPLATQPN